MRWISKCTLNIDSYDIELLDFGAIEKPLNICDSMLVSGSFEEGIFPESEKNVRL